MKQPIAIYQIPAKRAFKVTEACRYLGVGRRKLLRLVDEGQLKCVKLGARRAFLLEHLEEFVSQLEEYGT